MYINTAWIIKGDHGGHDPKISHDLLNKARYENIQLTMSKAELIRTEKIFHSKQYSALDEFYFMFINTQGLENRF